MSHSVLAPYLDQLAFVNEMQKHNINQFVPRSNKTPFSGGGGLPRGLGIPNTNGGALQDIAYKKQKPVIKQEIEEIVPNSSKPEVTSDEKTSDTSDVIALSGSSSGSSSHVKSDDSDTKHDSDDVKSEVKSDDSDTKQVKSDVKSEVKSDEVSSEDDTKQVKSDVKMTQAEHAFFEKIPNKGKNFASKTSPKIPVFIQEGSSTPMVFKSMRSMTQHGKTSVKRLLKGIKTKTVGISNTTTFKKKKGRLFLIDRASFREMGLSYSNLDE
jgi:hypothetical protein